MTRFRARHAAVLACAILAVAGCDGSLSRERQRASQSVVVDAGSVEVARLQTTTSAIPASAMLSATTELTIPNVHPRLWFATKAGTPGAGRLERARAFAASQPVPVGHWEASSLARERALRSVIRGQTASATNDQDCQQALAWLKGFTLNVSGTSSDQARWSGENAILVYDWCNYALSDSERATLLSRWNGYIAALNSKPWGGTTMAANNYFWGYLRNSLLWGIASYHDNGEVQRQIAQGFIDHALQERYRSMASPPPPNGSKFFTWYNSFGIGGVPLEGNQYGPYMTDYPVIAFTAATDYGYDAWNAVPFWRDAVYYLYYAATPTATRARDGLQARHELFPFNDDEMFANGGSAEGSYNDFLSAMILRDPSKPLAKLAQAWMQARAQQPSWTMRAELASATVTGSAPSLPLDYYAQGARFLYGRRNPTSDTTAFMLQLGGANAYGDPDELEPDGGVGHSHQDLGNFQLWRRGRWLTRESTGYGIETDGIKGWNNGPKVDPSSAVAHNTALFEGRGQIYTRRGWSVVKRLQSDPEFVFAAVDMTESYRAPATQTWLAEDDWPFAEKAVREFIYLRELDALIILDRMTSGSDSLDSVYSSGYQGPRLLGEQVRKSFVLHATGTGSNGRSNPFQLSSAQATAVVGDQRLDLRTLLPANPSYRVVDEGAPIGQFRLEYDVSGSETSYLLNVVSVRDASDAAVTAAIGDFGDHWQVSLSHPVRGNATVTLQKGVESSGGSVRIGSSSAISLRADRQGISIDTAGVTWEGAGLHAVAVSCWLVNPAQNVSEFAGMPIRPFGQTNLPIIERFTKPRRTGDAASNGTKVQPMR